MQARTWEFGTRIRGKVILREVAVDGNVLGIEDLNSNEAFVLVNGGDAPLDSDVTIEFRPGGMLGGHWAVAEIHG